MRQKVTADGYLEVNTPAIMPRTLWERSGHWGHYQKNMFVTESEKRMFAVKPMNCPGALEIFKSRTRSYKDLPLRLAEFGHCVRNEPSGTLHGIMRVRGFVQDDAHIICTEEQIEAEVAKFCRLLLDVYKDFGFDKNLLVKLSTMPEDHVGDEATWQHAEAALASACKSAGMDYEIQPGEGAFYGPKLEFKLYDCLGREWQCGTIQVDYQLPSAERLDATYIGADNQKHHPVMLHRAILGSFERFLGILIENFAGAFPTWLAFEQVAVVPISSDFDDYAKQINDELLAHDIRSNAYLEDENMKAKIKRISQEHKTPYILVVGQKEKDEGTVCVRYRFSSQKPQETMKLADFIAYVEDKVNSHFIGI
jgi:threonyl-tRNA synthetase